MLSVNAANRDMPLSENAILAQHVLFRASVCVHL